MGLELSDEAKEQRELENMQIECERLGRMQATKTIARLFTESIRIIYDDGLSEPDSKVTALCSVFRDRLLEYTFLNAK